ncbi:MAG: C10 family peptidase [Bacteroidota bacterium]
MDIDQAKMIASTIEFPVNQSFHKSTNQASRKSFDIEKLGAKKIKESKSPLGKNNKALYHIINYEDGGFVILSADDRLSSILAFSYDSFMPLINENEFPEGLADWYSNQKDLVEFIRDNPSAEVSQNGDIGLTSGINLWDPCAIQRQITPANLSYDPCDPDAGGGCEDQYTQVGPLLTTTWHQTCDEDTGNGYNQFMPTLSCSPQCGRAYAGCVPVAIAQVIRYHSYPQGYSYNNMPNNSGNVHNATLIADVFNSFPANQRDVLCSGTGISSYDPAGYGENYSRVLKNNFGYSSAVTAPYNHSSVKSNLNRGRPVILFGNGTFGHMWVADGYLNGVFCSGQSLLKLHMNWGWGGEGNGYFNYDNFTVTTSTGTKSFNLNKYMIYNIIP